MPTMWRLCNNNMSNQGASGNSLYSGISIEIGCQVPEQQVEIPFLDMHTNMASQPVLCNIGYDGTATTSHNTFCLHNLTSSLKFQESLYPRFRLQVPL